MERAELILIELLTDTVLRTRCAYDSLNDRPRNFQRVEGLKENVLLG